MSGRVGQGLTQVSSVVEARRNTFKKPKADPVRLLVYDILTEVNRRDGYSNLLLPRALDSSAFDQVSFGSCHYVEVGVGYAYAVRQYSGACSLGHSHGCAEGAVRV